MSTRKVKVVVWVSTAIKKWINEEGKGSRLMDGRNKMLM